MTEEQHAACQFYRLKISVLAASLLDGANRNDAAGLATWAAGNLTPIIDTPGVLDDAEILPKNVDYAGASDLTVAELREVRDTFHELFVLLATKRALLTKLVGIRSQG